MTAPFDVPTAPAAPPEPPQPRARRRVWPVVLGIFIAVAVIVLAVGSIIRLPYVIYSPGDATPVDSIVRITGAKTYPHQGQVLFLTVAVSRGKPNVWDFVRAKLDSDADVVGEDNYLQGQSRRSVERENVVAMTDSQLAAKKVALEQLGYTVTATGAGATVAQVAKGTPAAGRLKEGDVITAIDGQPVQLADRVGAAVRAKPVGSTVTFTVTRDGKTLSVPVTTVAAPGGELRGKPMVGISVTTKDLKLDFPVDIKIDPGGVTGPSAGLAFTLTLIDKLTPGDLTGGKPVAVTGTMDLDGNVGEVGGVTQKTAAAIAAGAKLMLTPPAEVREARARAGSKLKVVGVSTIDDALRALRENGGAPVAKVGATRAAA